jgi:hypothetical protein
MSGLLEITTSWASGATAAELAPKVTALLKSLGDEALLEVFKVLPRQLTMPHIALFRAAEEKRSSNEVATLLVSTNFENCGPVEGLAETISYAVSRVPDDALAPNAPSVFQWRQRLCAMAPKSATIDLDKHAQAAMVYALNAPAVLGFEDLYDAVAAVKFTRKETQLLAEFIDTVLLAGTGASGVATFESKAGKDFFSGLGVKDAALRKARLLSLCAILADQSSVTMDSVAKSLQLPSAEEAENHVVDAALANVIDVEVDRSSGVVSVKSVLPLRFDAKATEQLLKTIDENLAFVDVLIKDYGVSA